MLEIRVHQTVRNITEAPPTSKHTRINIIGTGDKLKAMIKNMYQGKNLQELWEHSRNHTQEPRR